MDLKLIILDWDDCITRGSSEGYYACYGAAVAKAGVQKTPEEVKEKVRELWGRPHREVIASIVGPNSPTLDQVCRFYEEYLFTDLFSAKLSLVPGAREKLGELKRSYTLAIATGMDGKLFREYILPSFDMQDFFQVIVSSSELPDPSRGKPYPDMVLKILEELSMSNDQAILVGDARGDVLMARAAGVRPIVVLTGQLTQEEATELQVSTIPDVSRLDLQALNLES